MKSYGRYLALASIVAALGACKGPEGPMGPQGPQGVQGDQGQVGPTGSVRRIFVTAVPNPLSETASYILGPEVGVNPAIPPQVSCYASPGPGTGQWIAVTDGWSATSEWCVVLFIEGRWHLKMYNLTWNWTAGWYVVY